MALSALDGDWSDCNIDNTAVKIWLPETLDTCLAELADRLDLTKSDLARNALMIHVHGRYTFERLVEQKQWRVRRRQQVEDTRKFSLMGTALKLRDSPRKAFIQAFGKNTEDLKVWMPRRLQDQITSLAVDAGLTPSECMRRALAAYYLGRTILDPLAPGSDPE